MVGRVVECDSFEEGIGSLLSPDGTKEFLGMRIQIVENKMDMIRSSMILHAISPKEACCINGGSSIRDFHGSRSLEWSHGDKDVPMAITRVLIITANGSA